MKRFVALAAAFSLLAAVGSVEAKKPSENAAKQAKKEQKQAKKEQKKQAKKEQKQAKKSKKEKPGKPGAPGLGVADLAGSEIIFKVKTKKSGSQINNLTLLVSNLGDLDAKNARVEWWLSDDAVLTTSSDPLAPVPAAVDRYLHSQSLGAVKPGRVKKRTLGGGLLKHQVLLPGQYIFAVIDPDNAVSELDEVNNVFGAPLPVLVPVVPSE